MTVEEIKMMCDNAINAATGLHSDFEALKKTESNYNNELFKKTINKLKDITKEYEPILNSLCKKQLMHNGTRFNRDEDFFIFYDDGHYDKKSLWVTLNNSEKRRIEFRIRYADGFRSNYDIFSFYNTASEEELADIFIKRDIHKIKTEVGAQSVMKYICFQLEADIQKLISLSIKENLDEQVKANEKIRNRLTDNL